MLLKGDCIEVMKAMKPNSVDAIVCDPPYGLEFMGKEWDKLRNTWQAEKGRYHNDTTFIAKGDRIRYQAGLEMQLWHTQWLTEAYRVLKPGASMLVMGGTRTSHRLACAIEDSGFIIKDTLMWLYGSGFPKAQDLGKMIDKRMGAERKKTDKKIMAHTPTPNGMLDDDNYKWGEKYQCETAPSTDLAKHWDGFKVGGIKPAYEPIIWAVKPPEGSYIDNVLKWGVGAVNVGECRIGYQNNSDKEQAIPQGRITTRVGSFAGRSQKGIDKELNRENWKKTQKGRFPANIILSHHPECNTACHPDCAVRLLDEQSGDLKSGKDNVRRKEGFFIEHGKLGKAGDVQVSYGDNGGASRFFYCAKASRGERNAGLEGMKKEYPQTFTSEICIDNRKGKKENRRPPITASNNHPTVKPIKLFEWLIKLVTREGQIVLDPFIGSGTTIIATHNIGRKCIGIEKEGEYIEIAKRRVLYWQNQPIQQQLALGEEA